MCRCFPYNHAHDFTSAQLRYPLNALTTQSWRMVVSRYALLLTVDLSAVPSTSGITGDFVSSSHIVAYCYTCNSVQNKLEP